MWKRSRIKLPPAEYKSLCVRVMQRDSWHCRHCRFRNDLHCHHIVFRSQGGNDSYENLITLCNQCHDAVHGRFLLLLHLNGEQFDIDASTKIRFMRLAGWRPR